MNQRIGNIAIGVPKKILYFVLLLLMAFSLAPLVQPEKAQAATSFTWDGSVDGNPTDGGIPINLTPADNGATITIASTATGTFTVPDGITELTFAGPGVSTAVADATIFVTNSADDVTLTVSNLSMTGADNLPAINHAGQGTLTLYLNNVAISGGNVAAGTPGLAADSGALYLKTAGTVVVASGVGESGSAGSSLYAPSLTINGNLTVSSGQTPYGNPCGILTGGSGLTVESGRVEVESNLGLGTGINIASGGNITVNKGASLVARGSTGIKLDGGQLFLAGNVTSTGMDQTAFMNGNVVFTDAAATLIGQDTASGTESNIAVSIDPSVIDHIFQATPGLKLNADGTIATTSPTEGSLSLIPTPIAELTVSAPQFSAVTEGYIQPDAQAVAIKNSGAGKATNVSLTLPPNSDFILDGGSTTIDPGQTITDWTLRPKKGLALGIHTVDLTLSADHGISQTIQESIEVKTADVTVAKTDPPSSTKTGPSSSAPQNEEATSLPAASETDKTGSSSAVRETDNTNSSSKLPKTGDSSAPLIGFLTATTLLGAVLILRWKLHKRPQQN